MFTLIVLLHFRSKKSHRVIAEIKQLKNQDNILPEQMRAVGNQLKEIRESNDKFSNLMLSKAYTVFLIILYIFSSLSILYFITTAYVDLQINASFKQRYTVLAPLLTDQEEEELQAEWASMQTRSDYLSITVSMDSVASAHNITLPKLLMK